MQIGMDSPSKLRGQIERITFANEDNGFTIAKMKVQGEKEPVTVVGNFPGINPGEVLELLGAWTNHPKFGSPFKAERFKSVMPASAVGIEKYLGSGLIKGIGPVMACRLVKHFGENTLEIIDTDPDRLEEVEGIGKKRGQMIRNAWDAQKEIREVMVFLQGHGVSSTYAVKIYKQYGQNPSRSSRRTLTVSRPTFLGSASKRLTKSPATWGLTAIPISGPSRESFMSCMNFQTMGTFITLTSP